MNERFDAFNEWEQRSWEDRADAYARGMQRLTLGAAGPLLDAVGATTSTRLLDIGCGPGPVSAAAVARGGVVVGVDVSNAMVDIASRAVPQAEFRVGSAEALPCADDEFDVACGSFVLPHVGHPRVAIAEALRAVRSGGTVAFTDWDRQRATPLAVFWELVASSGMPMPPGAPAGPSDKLGDHDQMRAALEAAGGVDVEVREATWELRVDPADWWDSVLAATPRTGAAIAALPTGARWALRNRYDAAMAAYPRDGDAAILPVVATIGIAHNR